jgi:4-phosphopantoate---beta-alanine ligase
MTEYKLNKSHPRYASLVIRDKLVMGVKRGLTSMQGLTAHGRGEAFDYLIGETTTPETKRAIRAAAAHLILAKHPVLSVNGNTAALVPRTLVLLSRAANAPLEVNLFHPSKIREKKIAEHLKKFGAKTVLLPNRGTIAGLTSNRKHVNQSGQAIADVILVPLEDGDRTEALKKMGKIVLTVDLNPLSRTARTADVTVVDNIVRTLPFLTKTVLSLRKQKDHTLRTIVKRYDNRENLRRSLNRIRQRLTKRVLL